MEAQPYLPEKPMSVAYGNTIDRPGFPAQGDAFRIKVWYRGIWRLSHVGFARAKDANCALIALVEAGYDTPEKIVEMDSMERRRIMCEPLAW